MKTLIAIDGSESSLHAVGFALGLLDLSPAGPDSITLISVHDDAALRRAKGLLGEQAIDTYLLELSEQDLASARQKVAASGIRHEVEIRTGHVASEIVDFAKAGNFELIVMGSKGRGAISDMLLGSVAQRVLATAKRPVLLVP